MVKQTIRGAAWPARVFLLFLLVAGCAAPRARTAAPSSQLFPRSEAGDATRSELQELATVYRGYSASSEYSEKQRAQALAELNAIERRLIEGDFGEGEVISLRVTSQTALTDTFVVAQSRTVTLPQVGTVSLRGVLRSELTDHLRQSISRVLRDPQVSAASMIHLAVLGQVNTPGFYLVPEATPLTDVLMTAGGPTAQADPAILRIERNGVLVAEAGPAEQRHTVGQLNLKPGDRLVLDAVSPPLTQRLQWLTMTVPLAILVYTTWLRN